VPVFHILPLPIAAFWLGSLFGLVVLTIGTGNNLVAIGDLSNSALVDQG